MRQKQEDNPADQLILIGLGANLPSRAGTPRQTLAAALTALAGAQVTVLRRSRDWLSPPWPPSDQPWFVNAVAALATPLSPPALLALLHDIEAAFGRVRGQANAARPLDLDLLAYGRQIRHDGAPLLPHPRLATRGFVLLPLAEVAELWRHPETGQSVSSLIAALPADQTPRPFS